MDINALKNDVQTLSLLKSEVKESYAELVDVGQKVKGMVSTKLVQMKDELARQFEQYFVSNDFEVSKTGDTFKASFNELEIKLNAQKIEWYEVFCDLGIPSKKN